MAAHTYPAVMCEVRLQTDIPATHSDFDLAAHLRAARAHCARALMTDQSKAILHRWSPCASCNRCEALLPWMPGRAKEQRCSRHCLQAAEQEQVRLVDASLCWHGERRVSAPPLAPCPVVGDAGQQAAPLPPTHRRPNGPRCSWPCASAPTSPLSPQLPKRPTDDCRRREFPSPSDPTPP